MEFNKNNFQENNNNDIWKDVETTNKIEQILNQYSKPDKSNKQTQTNNFNQQVQGPTNNDGIEVSESQFLEYAKKARERSDKLFTEKIKDVIKK